MPKSKKKEPSIISMEITLIERYDRWKHIYENGCTDPCHPDGVNLDCVRNHIIYEKNQMEQLLRDKFDLYPDCYFYPTPPKLPFRYMANDRPNNWTTVQNEPPYPKILPYEKVMSFSGEDEVKSVYGKNFI